MRSNMFVSMEALFSRVAVLLEVRSSRLSRVVIRLDQSSRHQNDPINSSISTKSTYMLTLDRKQILYT